MGLSGLSAFDLYMKIALSQAKVLCKNSKMDCNFTPGVKSWTYALRGGEGGKSVDIILWRPGSLNREKSLLGLLFLLFSVNFHGTIKADN